MTLLLLGSIALFVVTGGALFVLIYNRVFLQIRHGRLKLHLSAVALVGLLASGALAGYVWAGTPWMAAPALVLAVLGIGEIRRLARRRRMRAAPPVADTHRTLSLRRPFTTLDLAVRRYELSLPGWTGDRLRLVHLSDIHIGTLLPAAYYETIAAEANAAEADAIVITGDLIGDARHLPLLPPFLRRLRAPQGVFAVLGNHDWWSDPDGVRAALAAGGATWVGHGVFRLAAANGAAACLTGYEGPWGTALGPWTPPPAVPGEPVLCLTHTPDNVFRLARALPRPAVVFAGHYHAGQVRVPWYGSVLVPSLHGRLFDQGHFVVHGVSLFVSAGAGTATPPFRLYCHPDLLVVDLHGAPS